MDSDALAAHRSGAIVRAKLERNEDGSAPPTITYEKFVQELSSGDAFATSLIDALVGVRVLYPHAVLLSSGSDI